MHVGNPSIAVDNQAVARVCSELSQYAPKMRELSQCLIDVHLHTDRQRAKLESFRDPLRMQLDRLSMETEASVQLLHTTTKKARTMLEESK